jgi:SAM-dependent methyltransferase
MPILLPRPLRRLAWRARVAALRLAAGRDTLHSPARLALEYDVLFHVADEVAPRSVLFVGAERYTRFYPRFFPRARFATIDSDPACARWGSREHVVGDATRLPDFWPDASFDAVLCNGVYGWGIDSPGQLAALLEGARRVLVPGGFFLLGWNTGPEHDPLGVEEGRAEALFAGFRPAALGGRTSLKVRSRPDHCFRFFRSG